MNCPRCIHDVLDERERDGLTIDVCPQCRGVWLDRGELEKLIARATREYDEDAARRDAYPNRDSRRDDDGDDDRDDDDDDDGDDRKRGRNPRRKRGWIDSLGDIFS